MDYTHEQHTVHLIVYHIIWCPKRRRKVLQGNIAERLEQIVHEVANENQWEVIQLAIQPDHVHLFIRSNPYTLPTDIARLIKGRSSHVLRGICAFEAYALLVDTLHLLQHSRHCQR